MSTVARLQAVGPGRGAAWRVALLNELPGIAGLGLVCGGVYLLFGLGWTLIAAGTPLLLAYAAREMRFVQRLRRKA